MKKYYASILLTIASLIGGVSAMGLGQPEVIVSVPFDFVAGGKTLPAGKYIVARVQQDHTGALSISNPENGAGAFVLASQFESRQLETPRLSFEELGGTHVLSSIESRDGVYTIALPRMRNLVAEKKQPGGTSPSGTN